MGTSIPSIGKRYTKRRLLSLFITCAFPLHVWAIILFLSDVSWITERTNVWDAVGVGAYALTFALLESLIVFAVFVLVGFFTPGQWPIDKRVAFLSMLVLILSAWGIVSQLLFFWNVVLPESVIRFLRQSGHPLRIIYAASLTIVLPSIGVPVLVFLRTDRLIHLIQGLSERLSLLTGFYLFLDLAGLIIVILRNVS